MSFLRTGRTTTKEGDFISRPTPKMSLRKRITRRLLWVFQDRPISNNNVDVPLGPWTYTTELGRELYRKTLIQRLSTITKDLTERASLHEVLPAENKIPGLARDMIMFTLEQVHRIPELSRLSAEEHDKLNIAFKLYTKATQPSVPTDYADRLKNGNLGYHPDLKQATNYFAQVATNLDPIYKDKAPDVWSSYQKKRYLTYEELKSLYLIRLQNTLDEDFNLIQGNNEPVFKAMHDLANLASLNIIDPKDLDRTIQEKMHAG